MVINSFLFWLVFPFLFAFYWVIPSSLNKARKWYLIIVSYLIYMSFVPQYAVVLFFVTCVTFLGALCMERIRRQWRKPIFVLFLLASFFPLFLFKYLRFVADTFTQCLSLFHVQLAIDGLSWAIPIGISFYTLQAVAYLADVYMGKNKAERCFSDYVLLISFFPHVVSGPITLAPKLLPQIKNPRPFDYAMAVRGMKDILWGMFLKLVIADRAGLFVKFVYKDYMHFSGTDCILASFMYTLQIYADFAGYSLLAIGVGRTLGYELTQNFRLPYFAVSVTDFWHRWHISLSTWLKDYIYIPLGGSRCSKARNYWNILVTFLVSGVWHGANWTFIVWGLLHGVFQVIEKMLGQNKCKYGWKGKTIKIIITFLLVNFAWIFFRMPTLEDALKLIGHMVSDGLSALTLWDETNLLYFLLAFPILLAYDVWKEFYAGKVRIKHGKVVKWAFAIFLVLTILSVGVLDSGQFIYARF